VAVLGSKLGPTLFQLPPHLKKDIPRLEAFLDIVPKRWRVTIEFRNKTWFDDDRVFEVLKARDIPLCISDQEDVPTPLVATASWGYVRLHKFDYDATSLAGWAAKISGFAWADAFIYFKHDHSPASGPPVATSLKAML
jgi:uncharacterized protein YecE (DUF72 family)